MHLASLRNDDPFTSDFSRQLAALGPYEPAPHIAVAVSGGADSMALALLVHDFVTAHGGRITALTIDHGLRAQSAQEVHQVHAWMKQRGIACEMVRVHVPSEGNLQANAREVRYDALTRWCREHHVLHLCIGQHADDQAETVALHSARGDTHDGASGMASVSARGGVRILRPLLGTRKTALVDYVNAQHQPWLEDPSNTSDAYSRNRLRGTLDVETLCVQAAHEGAARHTRERAHAQHAAACVTLYPEGYAWLDVSPYRQLEPAEATMLLADLLRCLSGKTTRPRAHETARLHTALMGSKARATLAGFSIRSDGTRALFVRELTRMETTAHLPAHGHMRYDGRFDVTWRDMPANHTIAPLGRAGKKQMLGAVSHLPAGVAETLPALWHLEELVAAPHITTTTCPLRVTFAPPKPLAASPFWWFNAGLNK